MSVFRTSLLSETFPARDELLKMFFALPLEFQPGETWAYDNTGYYLLGLVVERVTGQSFWQFLEERVFRPLGMTATRNTDPLAIVPRRASGYGWLNGAFQNRPILAPFVAFSAGALLSSVEDLALWDAALDAGRLLGKASFERIWTPTAAQDGAPLAFDYGFGWFLDSYRGHRVVQHSGGTPGFSSAIYRFRDDRLTVILLTNHGDRILDQLAIDVAGMFEPALARAERRSDPDPKTSLRLAGIVAGLLRGEHDPGLWTTPMRLFLGTATGKGFWEWAASHGELGEFSYFDQEPVAGGRILRYRATLGGNPYWFSVRLAADGRIAQIYWW
jgi:hypothetical protein